MCGIIGYIGRNDATPILLDGLQKLEYRGYDSSGIGVLSLEQGRITVRKTQGKIARLREQIKKKGVPKSSLGISHTRWATHGAPNRRNAHPHFDQDKKILVVHNGIIENYQQIRERLQAEGVRFVSETDTEVIAQLIGFYYARGEGPCERRFEWAVRRAIAEFEGAFALGMICQDCPDILMTARIGSPLIIGLGEGENYIASDVPAILDKTRRIIYLKDGQMAVMKPDSVEVKSFSGRRVKAEIDTVTFDAEAVGKQGHAHFMLKEIHEQPGVLRRMIRERIRGENVRLDGIGLTAAELKKIRHVQLVACGTAYHAGLLGKYIIERFARVACSVDAASEFRYRDPILDKRTLVIAISQSGETADTLAAVREARESGAKVVSICNVVGSSLARESDGVLYTHAGPEIGVASTKAYIAQISMLYLLAFKLSAVHHGMKPAERKRLIKAFKAVPSAFDKMLKKKSAVARIAKKNSHFGCFLFLGRNVNYPSAMEGALKLKEISYIPAEGYAAGEMKHGPIALIDEYRAVVCIVPMSETYDKMISNIQEIRARKGKIIAIATEGDAQIKQHASHVITVPAIESVLTPLVAALPFQLLAYYIAVQLGCDVDQPRNLAKSVTVE
ncbi:MAG: glutamine--fructose-6-phosphate transaminase (isomerizing) [Candidatus Omnitrophota bacterium]